MQSHTVVPVYNVQLVREGGIKVESKACDEPSKLAPVFQAFIGTPTKEHVAVALLNARHQVIGLNMVSVGTLTASLIHPREIFQPALIMSAASIAVCHNHPSGDVTPSPEDCDITRRLVRAGELLGVPLLDHIIIAGHEFFSFKERGLLGSGGHE